MSSNFNQWIALYGIPAIPLIHAGAHYAEERDDYRDANFEPVFWIEALPDVAAVCYHNLDGYEKQSLISAAISDTDGEEVTFFVAGAEDSSSSIFKPYLIEASHPEVTISRSVSVLTTTLDKLYAKSYFGDFKNYGLILDLQGAELKAIQGAEEFLQKTTFVITEVSTRDLYQGGAKFDDLTKLLDSFGFTLHASEVNRGTGWGEALYINRHSPLSHILKSTPKNNIEVGKYSVGTIIRSILVKVRAPHWLINIAKRR